MTPTIIVALVTLSGSSLAALLTYLTSKRKHSLDTYAALQTEISRLRDDLANRDRDARNSHEEVLALRASILQLNEERFARELIIVDLRAQVEQLATELSNLRSEFQASQDPKES